MDRWTIKELQETDDFTFAMCILSERREMLNQEAPLAKKLKKAFHTLEELRDIFREDEQYKVGLISAKEAIYRSVERDYRTGDIKNYIKDHYAELDTKGMSHEDVTADRQVMSCILARLDKCGCENDYWSDVENSIEKGITDALEKRQVNNLP